LLTARDRQRRRSLTSLHHMYPVQLLILAVRALLLGALLLWLALWFLG
jgi:hypothetical protein